MSERHYLDVVGERIGKLCGMDIREPSERRTLRSYAVLCLALGEQVTSEHVHDAWAVDCCDDDHPCAVPFGQLSAESQSLDVSYRDAIRKVARERQAEREGDPDIDVCPNCGGYADNGFSREVPPSPYLCAKCEPEPIL